MNGAERLMEALLLSPDEIVNRGYAALPHCEVCGRAEAEVDCETEFDIPARLRMCRRRVDGTDPTCEAMT